MESLEKDKVIFVLTCERVEEGILACGGSQFWRASKKKVREECEYLIATRNRNHDLSEKTEQHHEGFLVGRISGAGDAFGVECSLSDRATDKCREGKWIIEIDEYAIIECPGCWNFAGRNPIRYKKISKIDIDFCRLKFKKVPPRDYCKIHVSVRRRKGHP